jgi:15-cis-phytoene synthase
MSEQAPRADDAQFCADEARAHDFAAYATTLFADPAQRRGLLALYCFAGEWARVRDHISQPLPGEIRLQWWTDLLAGPGHGGVDGHPVAAELKWAIAEYQLPIDQLSRLIDGRRHDLYDEPVESLAELEAYLVETSCVVVGLAARICDSQAVIPGDLAYHAGLAQGLVEVIGLLPRHAAGRRMLLPQDLLTLNAVSVEDVFAGRVTPGLQALLAFLVAEAEAHLAKARSAAQSLWPSLRPALLPLALTASALSRLRRVDCDPFRLQPASRLTVLWTLWRASRRPPAA